MSTTSRAGAAILALYQLAQTTFSDDDVLVALGPYTTGDQRDSVHIGYDGDPDGDFTATAATEQTYAGLGANARDEEFSVQGAVIVSSGDTDAAAAVTRVYALLGQLETALKADPSLGQLPPFVAGVVPGELRLPPDAAVGLQAVLPFSVRVKTRVLPNP